MIAYGDHASVSVVGGKRIMRLILEVRTNSQKFSKNPEGFRSRDRCANVLSAFCGEHNIPYSETFVSISVSLAGDSQKRTSETRTATKYRLQNEYGKYIIRLKPVVVEAIEVVCLGDFQTIVCNAAARQLNGLDLHEDLAKVISLRGKAFDEKASVLENAARQVRSPRYAEARIPRALRKGDDVRF